MSEWFETFRNATFKKVVRSSYISIQKHFFLILKPCVNTVVTLPDKIETKHGNE